MKFKPKSDKELAEERLLPEGQYSFEISQAENRISKAGNEMIELLVRVYKPDGSFMLVSDYLMESVLYKVSHASKACGLEDSYNKGELKADDFIGKTGYLKLGIQKDKNGVYPDKNMVRDYIVPKDGDKKPEIPKNNLSSVIDDEIPF